MAPVPQIVTRAEQPYVAIATRVPMSGMASVGAHLSEVVAWLGAHGLAPAGPPFFRYRGIDMKRELDVEAGVPVGARIPPDGNVVTDVLPAGRYAAVTHVGHPAGLVDATRALLAWADTEGLTWDVTEGADGDERWGCRLEFYLTDPAKEPDMNKWETELAFRLAD